MKPKRFWEVSQELASRVAAAKVGYESQPNKDSPIARHLYTRWQRLQTQFEALHRGHAND